MPKLKRSIKSEGSGEAITVWYYVTGGEGAVQFMLLTLMGQLTPMDLGYHAYSPHYDGHESMGPCEALGGKDCYYDGSGLNARLVMDAFTASGEDPEAIWQFLENYYEETFGAR